MQDVFLLIHVLALTNKTYFKSIYLCTCFKNEFSCKHSNFRLIKRKKATRKTCKEVREHYLSKHGFKDLVPIRKLHSCCYDMHKFQAKQAVLVVLFKAKGLYSSSKSQLNVLNTFYLQFYIQHNKTVFCNTIKSHIEIIYEKRVAWMKSKMQLKSWL